MVKVSVIVPVYKSEMYLERCLESLVNQTLDEIEIIAVNDASPDNSLMILEKYQKEHKNKIKIVNLKENLRQGGARNRGLRVSKGEYIGFVDADDWVDSTMYEKLYSTAKKMNADIVDADIYKSTEDGIIGSHTSITLKLNGPITNEERKLLILKPGRLFSKIIKRDMFFENNISFPEKQSYDDNEVVPVLVGCAKSIVKVEENLYYYFVNTMSTTKSVNNPLSYDRLKAADNMVKNFKRLGIYEINKQEIDFIFYQQFYANSIFVFLNKFHPSNKEYLNEIKEFMYLNHKSYRKNVYFKNNEKLIYKIYTLVNDISPSLLIAVNKTLMFLMKNVPTKISIKIKQQHL